jgi:DNA-binding transcriptional LysR family regulator
LTDKGSAVLSHAERMEEDALALQRQLAGHGGQLDGLVRLSSSDWFGAHVLTPVLAVFARMHPGVVVELITSAQHFSLPRREADLVFRIRPFDDPDVVSRRLMHIPMARTRDWARAALRWRRYERR